jgi:hypothetical protein
MFENPENCGKKQETVRMEEDCLPLAASGAGKNRRL